jgi:hypothetical protein
MRATHEDNVVLSKDDRALLKRIEKHKREVERLRASDRFEDNFAADPMETLLRHIKAHVDQPALSQLSESDKKALRSAFGAFEKFVKKVQDDDDLDQDDVDLTLATLDSDEQYMIARVMLAVFFIGCLSPSRQNVKWVRGAQSSLARKAKSDQLANDPVMQVIKSVMANANNRKLSGKARINLVNRELEKINLDREPEKKLPLLKSRSSRVERYLDKRKTPRS